MCLNLIYNICSNDMEEKHYLAFINHSQKCSLSHTHTLIHNTVNLIVRRIKSFELGQFIDITFF